MHKQAPKHIGVRYRTGIDGARENMREQRAVCSFGTSSRTTFVTKESVFVLNTFLKMYCFFLKIRRRIHNILGR